MNTGKHVLTKPHKKVGVPQMKGGQKKAKAKGNGEALADSVWGFGTVSPSALGRQPPPRSTSRPPARAGPRLSRPLGRSHLSAGRNHPWVLGL